MNQEEEEMWKRKFGGDFYGGGNGGNRFGGGGGPSGFGGGGIC